MAVVSVFDASEMVAHMSVVASFASETKMVPLE